MAKHTLKIILKYVWPFHNIMHERVNFVSKIYFLSLLCVWVEFRRKLSVLFEMKLGREMTWTWNQKNFDMKIKLSLGLMWDNFV